MTPRSWIRSRAKQMRTEMTPHEKAVWRVLHEGELKALNWRRQAPFGDYILDFVSHPARLVVEVDGAQHAQSEQSDRDAVRTQWLNTRGYRVVRIWNSAALREKDGVWLAVHQAAMRTPARARMDRWRTVHLAAIAESNARIASSSMEEAPRSGGGGEGAVLDQMPSKAHFRGQRASPPQSSLRDDSSSIEEERDA